MSKALRKTERDLNVKIICLSKQPMPPIYDRDQPRERSPQDRISTAINNARQIINAGAILSQYLPPTPIIFNAGSAIGCLSRTSDYSPTPLTIVNWSNYIDRPIKWFTIVPRQQPGDPIDYITYNEDNGKHEPTQCPQRSHNLASLLASLEYLASVSSTIPDGGPQDQWSHPEQENYTDAKVQ
jgi:hypothetical protein